uniref:Metalloendopeptidase n=1 Tax=Syphacia muris TaxID=451379 RepID=A0A0N5AS91_9BILA
MYNIYKKISLKLDILLQGKGCYSAIGKIWFRQRQELSVGSICEHFHTVAHELAHALGIFHTQSRPDRDRYVIINEQNAQRNQKTNFRAEKSAKCATYDIPYEYGSVMHYRTHEFSVNRKATVIPRNPLYVQTMGSGTGPSFLDVLLVNKHYNCLSKFRKFSGKQI